MSDLIEIRTQSIPDEVRNALAAELRSIFPAVDLQEEAILLSQNVPTWIEIFSTANVFDGLFKGALGFIGAKAASQGAQAAGKVWEKAKPTVQQWPHELYQSLKRAKVNVGAQVDFQLSTLLVGHRTTRFELDLSSEESFVGRIINIARAFDGIRKAVKRLELEGEEFPVGIECAVDKTGFVLTYGFAAAIKRPRFDLSGEPARKQTEVSTLRNTAATKSTLPNFPDSARINEKIVSRHPEK
jgi:hypothetical protein